MLATACAVMACGAHASAGQNSTGANQNSATQDQNGAPPSASGGQSTAQPAAGNEPVLLRKQHPVEEETKGPTANAPTNNGPTLQRAEEATEPNGAVGGAAAGGVAVDAASETVAGENGPEGEAGDIVVPRLKRKSEDTPPPPPAPVLKNPPGLANLTLRVDVPEVTVDVGVLLEKTHQFIPNLRSNNFAVYEDGQPQTILRFKRIEAPVTVLILAEFASVNYQFVYDMRNAAWAFAQQLRPQDYVAMMTYDLRTQIVTDFTQDKNQILEGIQDLTIPGFSERNLFDALYQSLDRLTRIEGQKYILLIGSGRDTFSRVTLDKVLQKIRETPNVTIFSVSTGGFLRAMTQGSPRRAMTDASYLQADNQMQSFARMTGGMFFAPRFQGELPDDMSAINEAIRAKYEIVYHPTNSTQDGTYRKIQVALVDDEGRPMQFQDEKHRSLKYDLIYRAGYRAQQQVR